MFIFMPQLIDKLGFSSDPVAAKVPVFNEDTFSTRSANMAGARNAAVLLDHHSSTERQIEPHSSKRDNFSLAKGLQTQIRGSIIIG